MRFSVRREEGKVAFVVSDVPTELRQGLEEDYFAPEAGDYVKSYPAGTPGVDVAARNFELHAKEMFDQVLRVKPTPWQDALSAFANRLDGTGIEWFLVGSCALAVRGVNVMPRDVDVVFPSIDDMDAVRALFAEEVIQPIARCEDWVTLGYGAAFAHALIAMAFEPLNCLDDPKPIDSGPYAIAHLEEIEWSGRMIKVPPVELLLNVNKRRGRDDRVRVIEEWVAKS